MGAQLGDAVREGLMFDKVALSSGVKLARRSNTSNTLDTFTLDIGLTMRQSQLSALSSIVRLKYCCSRMWLGLSNVR